jgi:hypothetical protein
LTSISLVKLSLLLFQEEEESVTPCDPVAERSTEGDVSNPASENHNDLPQVGLCCFYSSEQECLGHNVGMITGQLASIYCRAK